MERAKIKKQKKSQLPFRLNILFFMVFLLFSVLIIQLGVVQILNGEAYQEEINQRILDTTKTPVPRGKIFDRNYQVLVDNKSLYSITYTPPKGVQPEDKLALAKDLVHYISLADENGELPRITERNKKEYWYLENKEEVHSRLSAEEISEMEPAEQYQTMLDRITEEDLASLTEEDLEIIAIKNELDKAYSLTQHVIKNENITPEEYARVAEHLDVLPGINATIDWDREYPYEDTLSSFLGRITTQDEGILADKELEYLSKGYSRNDRVGRSGLEEQYEDLLRGRKEQIQYTTDQNGNVLDAEVIVEGQRGKDLVLTIDIELQEKVDEIVRTELETAINKFPYENRHLQDALAVLIDPKTGELLAVSGQHYNRETNEFENAAFKTIYDAHRAGSVVKGATVLAGYESGVITPNQTFVDQPIKVAGTPVKRSWRNLGVVNDIDALKMSSNVYMYHIGMRFGGEFNYQYNKNIRFNQEGFQKIRNYFNQFGLGVETGIDLPYEATGYVGENPDAGHLQDFAIGQYDTYTTMQLAQYIATIANDGYRVRPHLVKEIREPALTNTEMGPIFRSVNTELLNRVDMDQYLIERVQEGFRKVFQESGGTGYNHWHHKEYNPAGKTGTAENDLFIDGRKYETENLTLIGYAPFDDPEIAFAVVVPNLGKVRGQHPINHAIGTGILDAYFELQKERTQGFGNQEDHEDVEEE